MLPLQRFAKLAAVAALSLLAAAPITAQDAPSPRGKNPAPVVLPLGSPDGPWLFRGSDIPPDRAWTFGVLPNGVRYAVRRNSVPPGQISIRVAMDVGSLMERPDERGFAHLIEHLSFRASQYVADGESKRIWQRLGVTFGADTNAATGFTQTSYKLDLPAATPDSLDESMKILSGMMMAPTITDAALNAERPVVLAEQREQPGPQVRLGDASRELFFRGQALADHSPIGNVATLEAATGAGVKAFHDRWYRPDRAVVIVVGDMDPAVLEAKVVKYFSAWKGVGPAPAAPDFGTPTPGGGPDTLALSEPALPTLIQIGYLRPWTVTNDTIIFNQDRWVDVMATQVLNRRLETAARAGASFIAAGASLDDVSRSANITSVNILPAGDGWEKALADVRAAMADLIAHPPSQAEIDREVQAIDAALKNEVATAPVQQGSTIADTLAQAVDIHETVAGPEESYRIFHDAVEKGFFTPQRISASAARIFTGVVRRALINTPTAQADAAQKLSAALDAPVADKGKRAKLGKVSFDKLPRLGKPATVVARTTLLASPGIDQVDYSNGVKMLLFPNEAETGKVYVRVRFGDGMNALPADRRSPAWAADLALMASGIGKLSQEDLDRLTNDRQINVDFTIDEDAFVLGGTTSPADLKDMLRLIAAKLAAPAWDPRPVERAKAVMLAGYDGNSASPSAVIGQKLLGLLHGGDPRWTKPDRDAIAALTPAAFKAFWAPLLASGPIEVQVYGDVKAEDAVAAVAETIGALKPRGASAAPPPPVPFARPDAAPMTLYHDGQGNQAAAVIAWPTGAGLAGITESRRIDVLTAIFQDRLLDQLRSQAGASYSPTVADNWPVGLPGGGAIAALGLVPPDQVDLFYKLSRGIAADLVAHPVSDDELKRAVTPLLQTIGRYSTGNTFWLSQTAGATRDPGRIDALTRIATDYASTTAADVQAVAAKYLRPDTAWSLQVLPKPASAGGDK